MGTSTMSDFRVSSNGHCFFCLSQILEQGPKPVTQINSLQYLTRYLKMDLKKVFLDKGQVSPELLAKVEKARLKVELCQECSCLSERFSEGYRQLEKLHLELGSTLRLIQGKLVGADSTDKLGSLLVTPNWNGLLEIFDILRAEATQKGSFKLSDMRRVKIQKLSKKDIKASQFRSEDDFGTNQEMPQLVTSTDYVSDGIERTSAKMESVTDKNFSDDDNRNYSSEEEDPNLDRERMEEDAETRLDKIEMDLTAGDSNVTNVKVRIVDKKVVSRMIRNLAGRCSINPETGKRICNDCQVEFKNYQRFWYHYRTIHLKLRYKCGSCNKLFSNNSNLRLHQRTSGSCSTKESKFNCHLCEKSFVHKHVLRRHLEGVHYKLRKYECDLCEKKYNVEDHLRQHRNQVHR